MNAAATPTKRQPSFPSVPAQMPSRSLKIVVAYDDTPASERAARVLANLRNTVGADTQLLPSPWQFDQLMSLGGRCRAIADVTAADFIILSISRPANVPAAINRWFETCLARKRGQVATVLALFGSDDEVWTVSLEGAVATASCPSPAATRVALPVATWRDRSSHPFPFSRLAPRVAALQF